MNPFQTQDCIVNFSAVKGQAQGCNTIDNDFKINLL